MLIEEEWKGRRGKDATFKVKGAGRVSEFSTLSRQGTLRMRIDHGIRERCVMMIKLRSEYISGIAVIVKVSGGSSSSSTGGVGGGSSTP